MNGLGGGLMEGASTVGGAWVVLQGSMLVLIAGAAAFLCRRMPAAARHVLWSLAVAGVFALPA
ncbi:MAG: hypothetical protein ACR2QM_07470, partial [Longimicrobiales bacterium]